MGTKKLFCIWEQALQTEAFLRFGINWAELSAVLPRVRGRVSVGAPLRPATHAYGLGHIGRRMLGQCVDAVSDGADPKCDRIHHHTLALGSVARHLAATRLSPDRTSGPSREACPGPRPWQ